MSEGSNIGVLDTRFRAALRRMQAAERLQAWSAEADLSNRLHTIELWRDQLAAGLRERGFGVPDTQANFVWLPVGEQAAPLAAALESRAVITRPFAGEGVRVTVGTPEEDDVFLTALDDVRADAPVA